MIYTLRHRTTYNYGNTVSFARCVLRLTPNSSPGQTVLTTQLTVTPAPTLRDERLGPFGEVMVTVLIDKRHETLVIEANSRVDVHAPPLPDASASLPWEQVRAAAFASTGMEANGPAVFLYPTRRTPKLAEITEYARASFPPGRPIIEAVSDLMRRIHREFKYDPGATEVSTPVLEAFKARHGVCQDFAHIMICGLRGLGLPTSYISGYLRTIPPPGQPRLEGADATHAWVTVWCGKDVGWVGFDPTNAILAQNDHIELGVGRDYSDVAPIDGIILGARDQNLTVEVDVIPEEMAVA
ncbi:transglutaminase family protein [uncultured Phenylobacterium sp.]|uniref:transglutaminase family protein n=1 Tax=uncultured Phenylobacterium sp. TaxID=349273 RepID=UPI0025DE5A6C|nr:transglutaminase family protein [uncultured Phenylobacterium sp.]